MEIYILSKEDLSIKSICKPSKYEINLDEETNSKSSFYLKKCDGLKEGNFIVVNGLYKQFLFVIPEDGVTTEKSSDFVTVTALDISNIFDRKIIEKDTDLMTTNSIEEFIANMISENFVNSDDIYINISYIDIYWHTNTKAVVSTNSENGLYNFHTFVINCRQSKNVYTDFKFENGRLRIDISYKEEDTKMIDTTVPEVVDYNKIYETDVTAKVQVLIREDNSIYNLYLKTDRTTTEDSTDVNRANGKIETISVETADKAREEALNVIKENTYSHLVEFKIAKTSKLMDISSLYIGRNIKIKTDDDVYDSYISAMSIKDENFVYFKSGNLRISLLDKLKKSNKKAGNKLDLSGGTIKGDLNISKLKLNGTNVRICIGSQNLITYGQTGSSWGSGTHNIIGSYGYQTIAGIFGNIKIPDGYHKEYRLTYQGSTGGNVHVKVGINNIWTNEISTWSGDTFRSIGFTDFFKESDIVLEPTYNYSSPGTNLKIWSDNDGWTVWNITIHGYLVAD